MNSFATQSLVALVVTALLVFRFARSELKERTISARTLWIRPAILVAVVVYLTAVTLQVDPSGTVQMTLALTVGAVVGIAAGIGIVANTSFRPGARAHEVVALGNRVTFGIWIAALALRLLARFVVPGGGDPRTQLPLNCGTVMLAAAAFVAIAVGFYRAIRTTGRAELVA